MLSPENVLYIILWCCYKVRTRRSCIKYRNCERVRDEKREYLFSDILLFLALYYSKLSLPSLFIDCPSMDTQCRFIIWHIKDKAHHHKHLEETKSIKSHCYCWIICYINFVFIWLNLICHAVTTIKFGLFVCWFCNAINLSNTCILLYNIQIESTGLIKKLFQMFLNLFTKRYPPIYIEW